MKKLLLFLLFINPAQAHDHWINNGDYKSINNVHCCGLKDCPVVNDQITRSHGGYIYQMAGSYEFIPDSEVTPSEDKNFYRCHDDFNARRCFFAPVPTN